SNDNTDHSALDGKVSPVAARSFTFPTALLNADPSNSSNDPFLTSALHSKARRHRHRVRAMPPPLISHKIPTRPAAPIKVVPALRDAMCLCSILFTVTRYCDRFEHLVDVISARQRRYVTLLACPQISLLSILTAVTVAFFSSLYSTIRDRERSKNLF